MTPQPHNPAGLTPEQVGVAEGWRLLDWGEIGRGRRVTSAIQCWGGSAWFGNGWCGIGYDLTYRTRLTRAELAQLP